MALIYCRECGNQISDKAERCPHCGAAVSVVQQPEPIIYGSPIQKPKKHTKVIVGVIVALLVVVSIIAAILIPVKLKADEHNTGTYGGSIYTGGYTNAYSEVYSTPENTYSVKFVASAEPEDFGYKELAKYDVNLYVDGTNIGTIHNADEWLGNDEWFGSDKLDAKSDIISMQLTGGKHELKFVSADDEDICGYDTIDINGSDTLKYRLICRKSSIEVRER